MKDKKKAMAIIAGVVILGSLFTTTKVAYAANPGFNGGNFFSNFIEFISQKLGLDKAKVQSVVQEYKKQMKVNITPRVTMSPQARQEAEKKRLDALVSQGKITSDQENAILAIQAKYPFDPNATLDQRKTQMQEMQTELKSWAQGQGLDLSVLGRGGFGGMRGKGDFRGRGSQQTDQ